MKQGDSGKEGALISINLVDASGDLDGDCGITEVEQKPAAGRRRWLPSRRAARGLVGFVVLFFIGELLTRAEFVNPLYLPPLSKILASAAGLVVDVGFLENVGATLLAASLGLVIAVLVAVPIGILLGSSRRTYVVTRALVDFLRPIPSVALIPVAILLFGQHLEMKVVLVVFATSWPLLFNTIYGVHDVDPLAKDTARIYEYSRFGILTKVALPSAAPFIYTGIRFGVSVALMVTISAELLAAAGKGIGTYILVIGQSGGGYDLVFAATIITGLIGWVLNWILARGEERFFRWNPQLRAKATS